MRGFTTLTRVDDTESVPNYMQGLSNDHVEFCDFCKSVNVVWNVIDMYNMSVINIDMLLSHLRSKEFSSVYFA